jgi:hypothetical protein
MTSRDLGSAWTAVQMAVSEALRQVRVGGAALDKGLVRKLALQYGSRIAGEEDILSVVDCVDLEKLKSLPDGVQSPMREYLS